MTHNVSYFILYANIITLDNVIKYILIYDQKQKDILTYDIHY